MADMIEWSSPRLLCIAGDFTKYDQHAVQQINRNIELIKYKRYGTELLLLDLVHSVTADADSSDPTIAVVAGTPMTVYKTVSEQLGLRATICRQVSENRIPVTDRRSVFAPIL